MAPAGSGMMRTSRRGGRASRSVWHDALAQVCSRLEASGLDADRALELGESAILVSALDCRPSTSEEAIRTALAHASMMLRR